MKFLRRILVWVLISVVIQCSILFYLDKYYFATEGKVKTQSLTLKKTASTKVTVSIPKEIDISRVKVSYDGKYIAYLASNSIKIVNLETGENRSIDYDSTIKVLLFKWLPDRDRMFIAEQHIKENTPRVKFSSCEVKKTGYVKNEIRDNKNNEVYITLKDTKSIVEDIQLSTLTNMIYVKITHPGSRNTVYSINVMGEMFKVDTNYVIGKMAVMIHEDRLVYEDITNHKIYIADANSIYISKIDLKLIDIIPGDSDDIIYLGKNENNTITELYYGTRQEAIDKWKTISLSKPLDLSSIFVSSKGKVYLNDNLKGMITEQASGKQTKYQGILLQMYDNGIISYNPDNLKIIKTAYK